ncbi:hypothetical protein ALC60_00768 [Trachymyrmex zeteki]|uniref:Uncharacterized protein n=1 Tax=Mycetomoellerius zeteki TaxID=64791 RepID=A0A151XJI5_9HYME|nr:hypothetical protein ALC60_00768 [Trachymyrmex zeteki]
MHRARGSFQARAEVAPGHASVPSHYDNFAGKKVTDFGRRRPLFAVTTGLTAVRSTGKIASERKREPDGSSPLRSANSTLPYPAVPTTENSLARLFSCPMIQPYVVIGTLCGKPVLVVGEIEIASSEDSTTIQGGLSHHYEACIWPTRTKDEAEDEDRETIKEERKEDFAREEDERRDARLRRVINICFRSPPPAAVIRKRGSPRNELGSLMRTLRADWFYERAILAHASCNRARERTTRSLWILA